MSRGVVICRSNPIAPDPRVEKEARALHAAGWTVQVLGWDRNCTLPTLEQTPEYTLQRLNIHAPWRRGLGNLPGLLRWQIGMLGWLFTHRSEYSVIHACDFDTVLPALWAKRLLGKRLVYDVFDFYADMLRATPAWMVAYIRRTDLGAISAADAVILVDEVRRAQIAGARPKRVSVVVNSPEDVLAQLQAAPPLDLPPTLLRLSYVGLMQVERGLLPLVEVLRSHPQWRLELAGAGAELAQILAAAEGLPNITYHGVVAYAQALALNYAADVLPAFYDPVVPNHRYASPNKLFESLMLGKPLLSNRQVNVDRILDEESCGLAVTYGSVDEISTALTRLEDPLERQRMGANARRAYQQRYGWKVMAARLAELYGGLG